MRTSSPFPPLFKVHHRRVLAAGAAALVTAGMVVCAPDLFGGSLLYSGGTVTENFDGLGPGLTTEALSGAGSLPNDGSSPWRIGVVASATGNTTAAVATTEIHAVSDGSVGVVNGNPRLFNNGEAGTNSLSDRSLGTANTGGDPVIDLLITNSSGLAMSGFSLSFDTEWWRAGVGTAPNLGYLLYYSLTGEASSWRPITATLPSKNFASGQDLDGNAPANRQNISTAVTLPQSIATGNTFFLRWRDDNDATNSPDSNIAIDNFSFTGVLTVPVGKSLIYNRAHNEGSAPSGVLEISEGAYWLNGATPTGFAAGDKLTFSQDGAATINVPANVFTGGVTVSNAVGTYTIGGEGRIAGSLTKTSSGTLVLTSANSFSSVTLNGGTIATQAAGALGVAAPLTVGEGG
ncbi:MAG: type sorting protein, partial [Chthoniobacteraceae bacterium]|nr:type sorting protein [Chthoniobacteraceae bacterium]